MMKLKKLSSNLLRAVSFLLQIICIVICFCLFGILYNIPGFRRKIEEILAGKSNLEDAKEIFENKLFSIEMLKAVIYSYYIDFKNNAKVNHTAPNRLIFDQFGNEAFLLDRATNEHLLVVLFGSCS